MSKPPRPVPPIVRVALLATLLVSGAVAPSAQAPPPDLGARTPPRLPALVDSSFTVTIGRLDPGQTLTQSFSPAPVPAPGVMSVNGDWPVAIVGGGEGQVNRKIRVVLRSPFGQTVADGCGYSRDAKPTAAGSQTKPALSAAGQFRAGAQDVSGAWSVTVSYCDTAGAPPTGASRVLGDIKLHVSYRAIR
jgi:hypothetical protein